MAPHLEEDALQHEVAGPPAAGWKPWLGYVVDVLDLRGRGRRLLLVLIAVGWVLSGFYMVQPDEQGIVLRFGRWIGTTGPGAHYHLPWPIESVRLPRVTRINEMQLGIAAGPTLPDGQQIPANQMLTGDENIVEVGCTVFWRIGSAGDYLFKVSNPQHMLRIAAESALRDVVARTPLQATMSNGRQQVALQTQALLQHWLDEEQSGIVVTQVQLQRANPPTQVVDAFNDVQRARADRQRLRNLGLAYRNKVIPIAHGMAARIVQGAYAYQATTVHVARGQAKRFDALYATYRKAKNVTAWRLYYDSMDAVLAHAGKVVVIDSGKHSVPGVIPYLNLPNAKAAANAGGAR